MYLPDLPSPLVVIVGPTAVGKTEISIGLAQRYGGEIISADSRLLYRAMDIGTAKPNIKDRERVPHHLIDVANPDEVWSLALYQRAAMQAIDEVHARGKLSFLVGGTGQYIQSIIQGWEIPPYGADDQMRQVLEAWGKQVGPQELHKRLSVIDPEAASKIDPGNLRRTVRALEVIYTAGKKFSDQRIRKGCHYSVFLVGLTLPRPELFQRIDQRIDRMLGEGLIEEVSSLIQQGYSPELPAFSAIGYKQVIQYLQGKFSLCEAENAIKRSTRQFVRRQANWFKINDPRIHWVRSSNDAINQIGELIETRDGWITPQFV